MECLSVSYLYTIKEYIEKEAFFTKRERKTEIFQRGILKGSCRNLSLRYTESF